jgi:hypothetical protein
MSSNGDEERSRGRLPWLLQDGGNWHVWIQHVKDLLKCGNSEDSIDIYNAYAFDLLPDAERVDDDGDDLEDPVDTDYDSLPDGLNAADKKEFKVLRKDHARFYQAIRSCLSEGDVTATSSLNFNVPQLLRYLRAEYENDGSVHDRNRLRGEFEAISLEQYDTVLQYKQAFDRLLGLMRTYGIDLADDKEAVKLRFDKGLGEGWKDEVRMTDAQSMDYAKAWAYYRKRAKDDKSLPGSLVPTKASRSTSNSKVVHKVSEAVELAELVAQVLMTKAGGVVGSMHNTNRSTEICRDFQKGRCRRGAGCYFAHPTGSQPSQPSQPSHESQPSHTREFKCYQCGQKGHFKRDCPEYKAAFAKQVALTQGKGDDDESLQDVNIEGAAYMTMAHRAVHSVSDINFQDKTKAAKGSILMVLDGAATIGIVTDEAQCDEVREVEHVIKVGGEDKPQLLRARKKGVLRIDQLVGGRSVKFAVPVYIMPGFGCNILPECLFLKKGFSVNKNGQVAAV